MSTTNQHYMNFYEELEKKIIEKELLEELIYQKKEQLIKKEEEIESSENEEITIFKGLELEKGLIFKETLDKLPYYVKNFFKCIVETKINNHKENMSLDELRLLKDMFISTNSKNKPKTYIKTK